jgi:hypothetical protein
VTVVVHTWPQLPQLFTSVVVITHPPVLQSIWVLEHPVTHAELEQTGVPPVHAVPHAPQWLALLDRSTHVPPQLVKPGLHATPHAPALHVAVPLVGVGQA